MKLSEIHIYPVKSCAGISLKEAVLERRGLRDDRRWMVVDENGRFLTQRQHPRMCLIRVSLEKHALLLRSKGYPDLRVHREERGKELSVEIWGDRVAAISQGKDAAEWLSEFLGLRARLVFLPEKSRRHIGENIPGDSDTVSFADRYPLLVLSQESLDGLNQRLPKPIEMIRFRPNLVIRGGTPHVEDTWKTLEIGSASLHVARACIRCTIPTVDPATGQTGDEPLRTLSQYRKQDGKISFGQNAYPLTLGRIHVGDEIRVGIVKAAIESGPVS